MVQAIREKYRPKVLGDILGNERTKRIVANMFKREARVPGIVVHGPKGTGKSSMARIISRTLICPGRKLGDVDPCGACGICVDLHKNWLVHGVSLITRNCASLTMADVEDDIEQIRYRHSSVVLFYDEAQRAKEKIQDLFLTCLEDPALEFTIIFSTSNLKYIDEAMRQRSLMLELAPPTTDELVPHLENVCQQEGFERPSRKLLEEICCRAANLPRQCIALLEELMLESDNGTLETTLSGQFARASSLWSELDDDQEDDA